MLDGSPLTNAHECHTFLIKSVVIGAYHSQERRNKIMLYFVKDNTIHTFPVSKRCAAVREKEQLRDTIPHGSKECPYCMRSWPGDKE